MNSPHSGSEATSHAFQRLHPNVQRWIWRKGWPHLHPVQERAVAPILEGRDVLLSAPTAGGKTEAAFLPVASVLGSGEAGAGIGCLCVSPLKALINDQKGRLDDLCDSVEVPVHPWHGDVSQGRKKKALESLGGVLLITPESLEALFVRRGALMRSFWLGLRHVVIDELHAFIGSERGRQLQSLLHRVEHARGSRVPRIGLSATLGDMRLAAAFLRPGNGDSVVQIADDDGGSELRIQVRGYIQRPPVLSAKAAEQATRNGKEVNPEDVIHGGTLEVAEHLFTTLRGDHHLVFANSRARVEELSDLLRRRCERERLPVEFFPHHGSLSKELREDAENMLKESSRPATVIATTTLELGLDVGDVKSVAQVGVPPSVAAVRQRLGRSGRRGDAPAILRVYAMEEELTPDSPLQDALRPGLVQSVATVELFLREGFYEPPDPHRMHLSTLVQQLLSCIAERGGIRPKDAFALLCETGPFRSLSRSDFASLLRNLAANALIAQAEDGDLVLALSGERLVDHYDFYAAFQSPEVYRLFAGTRQLGSLPILSPIFEGMLLIFAGRRWRVVRVELESKTLLLEPASGGQPPAFEGGMIEVHDRIRQRMRLLYEEKTVPSYLNRGAQQLLSEGRQTYEHLQLASRRLFARGNTVYILPWCGTRIANTLLVWLTRQKLVVEDQGLILMVEGASEGTVADALAQLVANATLEGRHLAEAVQNLAHEKHDHLLPTDLARANYASHSLDVAGARAVADQVLRSVHPRD